MQNSRWVHVSCRALWSIFQILDLGVQPGCTYSQVRMTPPLLSTTYILISSWSKLKHISRKGWWCSLSGPQDCVTQHLQFVHREVMPMKLLEWLKFALFEGEFWRLCLFCTLAMAFRTWALTTFTWLHAEAFTKTTLIPERFSQVA